ncbi:MAG: anaerobic ribonucleoside-triphosphate reductase activating protein, partial [Clostridiales bacterium]|nr:anaerobic ribonucleoside-triphosphate reductase activating protein [Clostridiales bacterium]
MQIAGFQPNSFIDFKGRIAALVFTPYCNMRCWYCHNKSILDNPELLSEDEILKKIERDKFLLDGVVITGGEPTLQADLLDFIKKIKAMGLDVKVDTNGKRPDVIRELIELKLIDYIAMDVKAPLNKYFKVTPTTLESEEILRESINLIINS